MDDFWKEAAKWLWGLLVPLAWWIWNKQDRRIDTIEGHMVSKDAIAERKVEVDRALEARRIGERELHERINEHIGEDQKVHSLMIEKLAEVASDVAFIRGRMDK